MYRENKKLIDVYNCDKTIIKRRWATVDTGRSVDKSMSKSEECRRSAAFASCKSQHDNQIHMEILNDFCGAVLTAPDDTEQLALAYGNRSAFLLHIERYEDCIKDIDRAVNMTKVVELKVKLLCRKVECLKKSGSRENKEQEVLEQAEKYVKKLTKKDSESLTDLIQKVRAMTINADSIPAEERTVILETKDATKCVKINYSDEFGRHLLAEKDYAPGDIIFVEKAFVAHPNPQTSFTNCDYCLKTAWSGVPCKDCNWAMFCSEECRKKANELYHDTECGLIGLLTTKMTVESLNLIRLTLRAVIIGLNEAGSVSELMNRLKAVDECKDKCSRGFYKNGEFKSNTIESMYSLSGCWHKTEKGVHFQARAVLTVLIALSKMSDKIKLKNNFRLEKIDDIIKNDELKFLGSLMMKLTDTRRDNNDAFFCNIETSKQGQSLEDCGKTSSCTVGVFMAPLISLINHSCVPNAGRCFNNNKKIIVHALHPIKKGEQIFMSYYCPFYNFPLPERQKTFATQNVSECLCQACKDDWPPVLNLSEEELVKRNLNMQTEVEKRLYHDCSEILDFLKNKDMVKTKFTYFKMEHLQKLSEATSEAFQHLKQPSYLISLLAQTLSEVFACIYGLEPRNFGKCSKFRE